MVQLRIFNYITFLIGSDGTNMLAKLIDRRVRMEYSDESDDDKSLNNLFDEKSLTNLYSF